MTHSAKSTFFPAQKLEERQAFLRKIRADLLSKRRQGDQLRRLY